MEQEIPTNFTPLNIFLLVKSSQNNYGVKNEDFGRYRRYCRRKVEKLRKAMNYKYGNRTKFIHKDITKEKQTDSRILPLLLFSAEKNWSLANEAKISPNHKPTQKSRIKFYAIKKLKKALQFGKKLKEICKEKMEPANLPQAEAYQILLSGLWLFESQKWEDAQIKFITCREILNDLIKSKDTLSQRVFLEKVDQIQQRIKYCQFKLSKGKQTMSIEDIINMKKLGDPNLSNLMQSLNNDESKEKEGREIKFNNERYPIKSEQIYSQKNKIDGELNKIIQIKTKMINKSNQESMNQELMILFSETVLLIDEAIKMVDKEKEDLSKNTQGELEILKKISLLFQQIKINVFIDRNQTIFKTSFASYQNNVNDRKATPQTLSKLLTNTITLYNQSVDIQKEKGLISDQLQLQHLKQLQSRIFYLRTVRLSLVGQVYFNNDKLREAYSLWNQCSRCINVLNQNQKLAKDIMTMEKLQQIVKCGKLKCLIKHGQKELQNQEKVTTKINDMSLKEKEDQNKITLEKIIKQKKDLQLEDYLTLEILELPGKLQPIPPRPIYLNLFDSDLVYPALDKKKQQGAKSSWWNKWWK